MKTRLVSLSLAAAARLLVTALWTRASVAPMSREALASSLDSGIRSSNGSWSRRASRW